MQNSLVVLDNDLIRASYRLTANEMRLVLCALAQIPKGEPIEPKRAYYVTKEDFVKLGVTPNNVARDIREACSDLLSRVVVLDTPIGELGFHWVHNILHFKSEAFERLKKEYPTAKNDEEFINTLRLHNLLDSLPIIAKSTDNIVARIVFHENIIPYISQLKEQFTKLNLHDVFGFSSFYSFRFYLMMMQFRETGYLKISIEDLRKSLNLENKYKATKDFKVRVVDTAIDEINEKSPYTVSYEFIQKGRTYTHLELKFKEKKTKDNVKQINPNCDLDTPDMFTGRTNRELEIKPLTSNKQAFSYAMQIMEAFKNDELSSGLTEMQLINKIKSILLNPESVNDEYQQKVFKALAKTGFKH